MQSLDTTDLDSSRHSETDTLTGVDTSPLNEDEVIITFVNYITLLD